jgi:hypothetical protein
MTVIIVIAAVCILLASAGGYKAGYKDGRSKMRDMEKHYWEKHQALQLDYRKLQMQCAGLQFHAMYLESILDPDTPTVREAGEELGAVTRVRPDSQDIPTPKVG